MAITVRVLDLGELKQFVTEDDMRAVGEYALRLQQARIARGEGSRGKKMKRYDKDYAEERAEAGLPTDRRTLRRTGRMLDSRTVLESTATRATIGFENPEQYFYVQQAKTPFVKATKDERKLLTEFVKKRVTERLKENLTRARANKR